MRPQKDVKEGLRAWDMSLNRVVLILPQNIYSPVVYI